MNLTPYTYNWALLAYPPSNLDHVLLHYLRFFPITGGSRLSTYNSQTGRTIFHCHYTTSIKTATGEDLPAKIRVYSSPSENPLPDNTVVFAVAKVAAPTGNVATIELDAIAFYTVPGDIRSEAYQDNIPDVPNFVFGVGHVPQTSLSIPVVPGVKSFTLAMAEYVGRGLKQFHLLLIFPSTNRRINTPVPQPLSCTHFVGFFAGRTTEGVVQITIEHITLNLSPHSLSQPATMPTATTPQCRKYVVKSAVSTPSQPVASTSNAIIQPTVSTPVTPPVKRKRNAQISIAPNDSQAEEDEDEVEEDEPEEVLGKGKRKKKARTMFATAVIEALGQPAFQDYLHAHFDAPAIALYTMPGLSPDTWMDVQHFMGWYARRATTAKSGASSVPTTPVARLPPSSSMPGRSSPLPPSSSMPPSSPVPSASKTTRPEARGASKKNPSPPIVVCSDDEDLPPPSTSTKSQKSASTKSRKRRRKSSPSGSDSDVVFVDGPAANAGKKRMKKKQKGSIVVSRELSVSKIIDLDDFPRAFDVDEDVIYRFDLRGNPKYASFLRKNSMAALAKREDCDSWTGGSGGSKTKTTTVHALGGVECQMATHSCSGVTICSEFDHTLLEDYVRYNVDKEQSRKFFNLARDQNALQTDSIEAKAVAFYLQAHRLKCKHENDEGVACGGDPVYREFAKVSFDGKKGFIGCSKFFQGERRSHRFLPIEYSVDESIVRKLFQNGGKLDPPNADLMGCYRMISSRSGVKGDALCDDAHTDSEGQIVQGKMVHHPCPAKIRMYFPVDRTDHRLIVHVSLLAEEKYATAAETVGTEGLTPLKCDLASSTAQVFGGVSPTEFDPALTGRKKAEIIKRVKLAKDPMGLGIEGVMHWRKTLQQGDFEDQYIWNQWNVSADSGGEMIVCMLPYLARRLHSARYTLHDNTYARVHGIWKEWEVTTWDDRLNCRLTVARIYSQHETEAVFLKIWHGFFEAVKDATKRELKIKFLDGEGLRAILLDGSKPQANALGKYLVSRNRPEVTGIHEADPKLMLLHVLRTCMVHLNRKFTELAKSVPDDEMRKIRLCPFIETQQELEEFIADCKRSQYKQVRDWIADKDSIPWFFPSFNGNLSRIPKEDWATTPRDTNLNESAHPFTNQNTGTNLVILDAVRTGYRVDCGTRSKLRGMEDSTVLLSHLNTPANRNRKNTQRRAHNLSKVIAAQEARTELGELEDELAEVEAKKRELQQRKKELKTTSGVKKTVRAGEKQRVYIPTDAEMGGVESAAEYAAPQYEPEKETAFPAIEPTAAASKPERFPYIELAGNLEDYLPYDLPAGMSLAQFFGMPAE
ncbi:hypothetical protein C8F01DRAFT_1370227 [Mycena amicta]|nr:hypothetical protein C8F01DRAFT_1370227 [Mycena amicta]